MTPALCRVQRTQRRWMSDKPETQDKPPGEAKSPRNRQPTFEEILSGAQVEEKKAPPPAPPKKPAQPSFDEILARAHPAPETPATQPPPERRSRPPRPKEERKMPIVVRKPTLGAPAPSEPPLTQGATSQPSAPPPERKEDPGSVFAQPSAEESVDFGALLAESPQQQPQGKLRPGQKVSARVAHLGGEVAFLDLGG